MSLSNCKLELKLKWTKYCVLPATGKNKIIHKIDKIICFCSNFINKNYQNFLAKYLKDQFLGMNAKQKVRIKIRQMNIDILPNQILLESI